MKQQQTCKLCGYPDKFNYNVPDEIWEAVVPLGLRDKVICLSCFDELACEKGVNYDGFLRSCYFAGSQASFELQVVMCVDSQSSDKCRCSF